MAKKLKLGEVVARSGDKTVVVSVKRIFRHPLYRKQTMRIKKFMAHDEKNEFKVGDKVYLKESRPHSRRKHFLAVKGPVPASVLPPANGKKEKK